MLPEHYKESIHLCVENKDSGKRLDVFLSDKIVFQGRHLSVSSAVTGVVVKP